MTLQTVATEVAKSAPPAVCVVCSYFMNIDNDIKLATLLYVIVQIFYLIAKWRRESKESKEKSDADSTAA